MTPSTPSFSVSAPANILLMGEYAVLEEGGLGLALSPDIRVTGTGRTATGRATTARGPGISVVGHLPNSTIEWNSGTGWHQESGLLGLAADYLSRQYPPENTGGQIDLESARFFTEDGRKRGLGSSAAVTVALTALWLQMTGRLPSDQSAARELVFLTAVDAHRAGQDGAGSGYDVASSTFGGVILFTGGRRPAARRLRLPWLPDVRFVHGPAPVGTVDAVGKHRAWKAASPEDALAYVDESNRLVTAFAGASDWGAATKILAEYRDLAVGLGDTIGVPAVVELPGWATGRAAVVKGVGAGNELGVVLSERSPEGTGSDGGALPGAPITMSLEGVTWT